MAVSGYNENRYSYGGGWGTGVLPGLQNRVRPVEQAGWVRFPRTPAKNCLCINGLGMLRSGWEIDSTFENTHGHCAKFERIRVVKAPLRAEGLFSVRKQMLLWNTNTSTPDNKR